MTVWSTINSVSSAVFDVWFGLMAGWPDWSQILLISIPVTVLALLIFRYASNQAGIQLAKDRIKGYLLELWLYKDDLGVMLGAQGQVFMFSLRYMALAMVPMAIMLVPVGLVVVQLESQFAYRGLMPGETTLFVATVDSAEPVSKLDVNLELPDSVTLDSPALRIDQNGQLIWRLKINSAGSHDIALTVGQEKIQRRIQAGENTGAFWPQTYGADDWRVLGSAAESPLPAGARVVSTEVEYTRARGEFVGLSSASWLMLLFTLILGFTLRGFFGVTF